MKCATQAAALLALLAGAPSATAADDPAWLVFGGVQGSAASGFSHLGLMRPLKGARWGEGFFHRTMASWLSYEYDTTVGGQPTRVKARAPGLEAGVGHAWRRGAVQSEASLGVGVRDTDIDPAGVHSSLRGQRWALIPQVAMALPVGAAWEGEAMASYQIGPGDRFVRARLIGTRLRPGWRIGAEVAHQQGRTYRNLSAGVLAGKDLAGGVRLELSLGQVHTREGRREPCIGLAFSWMPPGR